ncbi:MAG TPA: hypothetical protein VMT85_10345 [Thermoanaerobaculia bacterium]|nr:hypothetical protein [Thermoanaerobaculia bacterium]
MPALVWLGAAAFLLVIAVVGLVALIWWLRFREAPARTVTVEQTLPEESSLAGELPDQAPPAPLPEQLEQALLQIADGELLEARDTLEELTDLEEEGALPTDVSLAYYSVVETLQRARAQEVTEQLTEGVRRYDLSRLNGTLRAMNGEEERLVAATTAGRDLLDRSRAVLSTANSLEQLLREGQLAEALERATRLEEDDPGLAEALNLRARSAEGIEESIDALITADRMEEADQRLRVLERLWPGRAGSAGRRQTIESRIRSKERYESLLESIAETGRRDRPHEGLEMIAGVQVPAEYRDRLARLEESLRQQLRDADRQPPLIQLVEEDPEYRRNQPILLQFQVTDDYEVLELSVRARRNNESAYDEIAVEKVGDDRYRVELSPSFHDNKPILFWAEARDRLGNVTRFAGPESPVELRRGRWRR